MKKFSIFIILSVLLLVSCGDDLSESNTNKVVVETTLTKELDDKTSETSKQDVNPVEEKEIPDDGRIYIREKMFLAQINDIYINLHEYLGKEIYYEGFMLYYDVEELNKTFNYVVRNGPGCCGNDAFIGFEILWNGEMPEENEWLEVSGVLEEYEEDGMSYLRLRLNSLEILEERGIDTIYQ